MRPGITGSSGNSGFIAGVVAGALLPAVFVALYNGVQWLLNTHLSEIVTWWTTEQTLTYVPLDVVFQLIGALVILLVLSIILTMPMLARGDTG